MLSFLYRRCVDNVRRVFPFAVALAAYSLVFLATRSPLYAQTDSNQEEVPERASVFLGLFGGLSFNNHVMSLSPNWFADGNDLPTDRLLSEGSGVGGTLGVLFEYQISRAFGVGARFSWQARGGESSGIYTSSNVATPSGASRTADIEATVPNNLNYIAFTPHIRIVPESLPIYFFAGPTVLAPIGTSYDYSERILPTGEEVVFRGTNGSTRTLVSGNEVPATSTKLGATVGAGVEIFLSPDFALIVDGQYSPMIGDLTTDLIGNEGWRANAVTLTAGFKFGLGRAKKKPVPVKIDTVVAEKVDSVERFRAGAVTDQGLKDTIIAGSRKVQQTEVHALLPYIFFERDSAYLPDRYHRIDRRDIRFFQEEKIERGNTLNVYYNLLNIIGDRLRKNRRTEITITGCIGQFEMNGPADSGDSTVSSDSVDGSSIDSSSSTNKVDRGLAMRRAEAVRDYLRDVWRIREDRMKLVARELPPNPSMSEVDTLEGDVENQRVEIYSNDLLVLAPVRLPDTLLLQPAGVIRLLPPPPDQPDSVADLESWQVNVAIGDTVIRRAVTGYGAPPEQIDFELLERPDLARHGPVEITSELVILDSLFEKRRELSSTAVWFVEEGDFEVERNVEDGKYVDRYNLLLYSFDSSGVFDFSQQAKAVLLERITPQSTVTIIGHTDRIGLPPYNKKLSKRRADVAAEILGLDSTRATIVGMGEKELLYDNDLPEGRYFSRTVTVIIETPIPKEEMEKMSKSATVPEEEESATTPTTTEIPAKENASNTQPTNVQETEPKKNVEKRRVPTSATLPAPEE